MLPYFRKYAVALYVFSLVVPFVFIMAWSSFVGWDVVKTLPGLFSAFGLYVASFFVLKHVMNRRADAAAERLVSLYNDECNPQTFLVQAKSVAHAIGTPRTEMGSWFLSFYALALTDEGYLSEAAQIGERMRTGICAASNPQAKMVLLVNIEPVVARLLGVSAALATVDQAEGLLRDCPEGVNSAQANFLAWERGVLEAKLSENDNALLEKYAQVRKNPNYPRRMRVLAAFSEAKICRTRNNTAEERGCLFFVVEQGNGLPEVDVARMRLAELTS